MDKLKVMVAAKEKKINELLRAVEEIEITDDVYYREGVITVLKKKKENNLPLPEVIVLSESLEGQPDTINLITEIRNFNCRVVYLAPKFMSEPDPFIVNAIRLGVLNILFSPISIKQLVEVITDPPSPVEAIKAIRVETELAPPSEAVASPINDIKERPSDNTRDEKSNKGVFGKIFDGFNGRQEQPNKEQVKGPGSLKVEVEVESKPKSKPRSSRPVRTRSGQPAVILGFGSKNLTDWFNTTFSNLVDIVGSATSPDEFRKTVHEKRPDLVVLMRIGPMGGLPEADALAEWATEHVPAVLFIAGELDENGEQMAERVKELGGHVLSCPPGETINGDELVVMVQYIVREISCVKVEQQPDAEEPPRQPSINLEALKKGATQLTSILKQGTEKRDKSPGLLTRLKSQFEEGLSLEESSPVEMLANNVKNPTAIIAGGLFAVVSPWRPGLAGRIAAAAAKIFAEGEEEVAVIGASGHSTAGVWLDITDEELMMSDWRVPGSQAPMVKDNIKIWAVDPAKSLHLNIDGNLWVQLKEVRKTAAYTVIDFAGDFELAQKVAFQGRSVVLVIIPGGDPVEQRSALLWLNRFMEGKNNIIAGIDLRGVPPTTLQDFKPKLVIRNSPADALKMALRKNLDEFIWN